MAKTAIQILFRAYEAALTMAGFWLWASDHRRFYRGGSQAAQH
jgi:hypothetical protein